MNDGVCRVLQNGDLNEHTRCGLIDMWSQWVDPLKSHKKLFILCWMESYLCYCILIGINLENVLNRIHEFAITKNTIQI